MNASFCVYVIQKTKRIAKVNVYLNLTNGKIIDIKKLRKNELDKQKTLSSVFKLLNVAMVCLHNSN